MNQPLKKLNYAVLRILASVLAITLFVLLLPSPIFAQSEKQRYEGLTYESKLNDGTNQLVSYSSSAIVGSPQSNAHRLEQLNATAQTSQPGAIIFLADGVDILAMIPNISGIPPETRKTDYLNDPINTMVKAMGIPNITIYQFTWSGDPGQTWSDDPQKPNVLKNLKEQLVAQYNDAKALNEKFIVISHSWGAALTYWALSDLATTVKPDLYITLSSPLGPPCVFYFNQGFPTLITKDLVVSAYVSGWEYTLQNDKADHWIGEPNTVRHINYWAWGDPISGPMSSLKQGIEDVQVDSPTSIISGDFTRNLTTLLHWHPFTGLADQDFLLQPTNNQQLKDMISNAIKQAVQSSPIPPSITTTAIVSTAPTYPVTTTSMLTSSSPTTFTIPQLVAPDDGITLQINQNTTFRWSNTGATRYKFEVWNDTNKMNYSFDVNGTSTQFAPVSEGSWRWQVRSYSSNGQVGDPPYTRSFKVVSVPSQPSSGIALYDGPNYTGPFTVLTMGKYSNLADYSWSDRIESIRFLGDYSNNYHVVLYSEKDFSGDPGHYDADASTLGNAQQNHVRSVEIYRKNSGSGIELYDGQNFSGTCVFLPVAYPEGKYADLTTVGFWDRAESIKFVGDCAGGKCHAVLFSEKDFQGDPAHFDNDATTLPNAQQNHVRSVSLYMHQPPGPPTNPNPASGTVLDKISNSLDVSFDADGDEFQIHVWGNNFDRTRDWDTSRSMHLDGLVPGQTYYWQAQGKNNIGESPWSPQWSFTTTPTASATSSYNFTVSSTIGWQQSPLYLNTGDTFYVTYVNGSWTVDRNNYPQVGPSGYTADIDNQVAKGFKIIDSLPYGTLIGKVGDGSLITISNFGGPFKAEKSGYLFLRINDIDYALGDNAGAITVALSNSLAPSSPTSSLETVPPPPSYISPSNNATVSSIPTLRWRSNGGTSTTFSVCFSTYLVDGNVVNINSDWSTDTFWQPPVTLAPGTYAWHVLARNQSGVTSDTSPLWSNWVSSYGDGWWEYFTYDPTTTTTTTVKTTTTTPASSPVLTAIPTVPGLISPANETVFNQYPRQTTVKWNASKGSGQITYTLQVQYLDGSISTALDAFGERQQVGWFPDGFGTSSPGQASGLTSLEYSFNFVGAQPGRWRVRAENQYGSSEWSDWLYFRYTQ